MTVMMTMTTMITTMTMSMQAEVVVGLEEEYGGQNGHL